MKTKILILSLVLSLMVTSLAFAIAGTEIPRWVLSGGATDAAEGVVSLRGTLGQPVVGVASNGEIKLGQGFWFGGDLPESEYNLYLPIVLR